MQQTRQIAEEISILMPAIMRKIVFRFLQKTKVSHTQLFTLITIDQKNRSATITELSKDLNVTPPTATRLIDRLERDKYVKRIYKREDRRTVHVFLTLKGVKLVEKLKSIIADGWDNILSDLTLQDRENYLNILRKIREIVT